MIRFLTITLAAAIAACGGSQLPADARTTVVSLNHLDCAECGAKLAQDLTKHPGVYRAGFDKRRAEITIVAGPGIDAIATAKELADKKEGYEILPGAGHGHYVDWAKPAEGADVRQLAQNGEDVPDLAAVVVKGKITIVDFSAIWCEPCRKLDEHVLALVAKRPDVAYRKLDIGDWDTPLGQRYLKGVPNLPYVIVFDKSGAKLDSVAGLDLAKLDAIIARGEK